MSFVSPSAPLPVNSGSPAPAVIDTAMVARIANASRTGRERVYANIPTAASFWDLGPGLAVDASQILPQSEQSRQAVLIGLSPETVYISDEATLEKIQASAPVVSSLTGSPGDTGGASTSESGLMPAPAPHQTFGHLWASAKLPGGGTGYGQRGVIANVVTRPARGHFTATPALGPGCSLAYLKGSGFARPPAPPWGGASMMEGSGIFHGSGSSLLWLLAAGVGLALLAKKKGRR